MPRLEIVTLGPPDIRLEGQPVSGLTSNKVRALLFYLAVEAGRAPRPAAHRRESLAGLLWPDYPDRSARTNLSNALSNLRTALKDRQAATPLIEVSRQTIQFKAHEDCFVDVLAFEQATAHERWQEAADLYRGPFLEGFSLRDSPEFEQWALVERERMQRGAVEAMGKLVARHQVEGNLAQGIAMARRQLELIPWNESVHRALMRLLALDGQRSAALTQYEACRQVLADELDVQPESETLQLYQAIRNGELQPPRRTLETSAAVPSPAAAGPFQATPAALPAPPATLPPPVGPDESTLGVPALRTGERRLVTALWARVNGPETLLDQLGPEAWRESMADVGRILEAQVTHFGGQVLERRQDGLLALFGVPASHEDDPERAVLAALAVQEAIDRRQGRKVQVCIGIESAEVLVTYDDGESRVTGRALTLARRAGVAAEPGTVQVGENAYRLLRPLFEWSLASGRTQRIHRPQSRKGSSAKGRGLPGLSSPLVGREQEMRALVGAVDRLQSSVGGVVTLIGEAGVGKSRLVAEVRRAWESRDRHPQVPQRAVQWVEGRCLSFESSTPYQLWLDLLHQMLGLKLDADSNTLLGALRDRVQALCPDCYGDVYPYLARLLSLPLEPSYQGARDLEGESLRVQIFSAVETLIESAARRESLIIVCEDLHWADSTSLALLDRVFALVDRVPVCYICVFRPRPEHTSWQIKETAARLYGHRHTELKLDPLTLDESRTLVTSLLRIDRLPDALRTRILDRAEGNPFYVEEIIRSLVESGALVRQEDASWYGLSPLPEISIPETLQGVLASRIDRLAPQAKGVLQVASVIGRTFTRALLSALEPSLSERLDTHLVLLQRAQLIREQRRLPETEFAFKHTLIQEVAYHSLLVHERRHYHRQAAEVMEQLFAGRIEGQLGLLAYHWERANVPEEAIPYLLRAGEHARSRYSNQQALAHLHQALILLGDLAPTEARKRWQLRAHSGLGQTHLGLGEVDDAEVHLREAIALGRELGLPPRELVGLYYWLADTLFWKSQYAEIIEIGQEGVSLLGDDRTSTEMALMTHMVGIAHAAQGSEQRANQIFCRNAQFLLDLSYTPELRPAYTDIITMYRQGKQVEEALRWSALLQDRASRAGDLRALGENHGRAGIVLASAGDWRGALARYQQGQEVFAQIGDARHQGATLANISQVHLVLGELDQADEYAQRAIRLTEPLQTQYHMGAGQWLAGKVALCRHDWRGALDALQKAADNAHSPLLKVPILHSLGRAYLTLGQPEQARAHLRAALALAVPLGPVLNLRSLPLTSFAHASLDGLEATYQDAGAFHAFCRRFQEAHPETLDWPLVQWFLVPAEPRSHTAVTSLDHTVPFSPSWSWHDPFGDCSYRVGKDDKGQHAQGRGVEIYAANGRDLWQINQSAPRLTRTASGDLAVQARCIPVVDPVTGEGPPAIGGLLLWQDEQNYLRLDRGLFGARAITLLGCAEGQDVVVGRGSLGAGSSTGQVHLRLERTDEQVTGLCSPDGRHWFTAGQARLPTDERAGRPLQVGLYAVGLLDRSIYHGAYPTGTAIRFESFQLWTCASTTPPPAAAGG